MSGLWKKQQQTLLRKAWERDDSVKTIAEDLGVSINAVRAEAQRMGLPSRREQACKARREALALCKSLKAYWGAQGCSNVEFHPEIIARFNGAPIYGVRSNLVNGLPPEAAAEEAA